MSEIKEKKEVSFTDYLSILYKWKRFLITMLVVIFILSSIYALLKPNTYKATATFMIPASKDFGLGGLGSLLSGESSALDIGSRLLGVTSTNEDMMLGFMKSKVIVDIIAKRYNLYKYYEIKDHIYEDLFRALNEDLIFDSNEYGFIEASVVNRDSVIASKMVMDFIHLADSLNVNFNLMQAKSFREFVEKRYDKNISDLRVAEENYYEFQKSNGVFDIPEQVKAMVEASSRLEAQVTQQELLLAGLKEKMGTSSPQYKEQKFNLKQLKSHLKSLYNGKTKDDFFISIKDIPELQKQYIRLYRDLEIQNKTLQFVYPIVEQARIDEKKNIPTVLVIDKAFVPRKKYAPKRSFIVLGIGFFSFWILLALILRGEKVLSNFSPRNIIEEKEIRFYKKLSSVFKVKL